MVKDTVYTFFSRLEEPSLKTFRQHPYLKQKQYTYSNLWQTSIQIPNEGFGCLMRADKDVLARKRLWLFLHAFQLAGRCFRPIKNFMIH